MPSKDPKSLNFPLTAGDLNIYHARSIADQQITYVLEFSGTLEAERLNVAAAALLQAFPMLATVVQGDGTHLRRKLMLDTRPTVSIAPDGEPPSQAIEHFVGTPCEPDREPPLKLHLVRGAGQDTLCLKADHVLTDAAGLKVVLYALAEAYATGGLRPSANLDRGLGQVYRRFSLLSILKAATRSNLPRPGPTLIAGPFAPQPTFVEHVCLEPGDFERTRAAAKHRGATLNDMLLAAVFRAIWQRQAQSPAGAYPVMVPVDMRRYLPETRQAIVGNLSSAVFPALAALPAEPFPETLARVTAGMEAFKRDSPGLANLVLMSAGAMQGGRMMRDRYRLAASRGSRFVNLTNFGVIEAAHCDFGVPLAGAYGIGPVQYAPGILIAISTCSQKLHLVVQGNDTRRFQPFIHAFLESLLVELRQVD